LFPCFDQPNFISGFDFFYGLPKCEDKLDKYSKSFRENYSSENQLFINNSCFIELKTNFQKDEVAKIFLIDISKYKIYGITHKIFSNTNEIILIGKSLESYNKIFELKDEKNIKNDKYNIKVSFEACFEEEIKDLIRKKSETFYYFYKLVFDWFSRYFDTAPKKTDLGFYILKELNKQLVSSHGNIVLDISNFNPQNDIIEKNYLNFLIINQM
jgi:hypothetical protein